jgi:hypothetical protein
MQICVGAISFEKTHMNEDEIETLLSELQNSQLLSESELDEILDSNYVDFNQVVDLVASPKLAIELDAEAKELLSQIKDEVRLECTGTKSLEEEWAARIKDLASVSISNSAQVNVKNLISLGKAPESITKEDLIDETENWCCICSEDGAVSCSECDDDIYCKSCFRQGHDRGDFLRHIASKLKN